MEDRRSRLSAARFRTDAECLIDNNRKWQDRWETSEGERVHECVFSPVGKSLRGDVGQETWEELGDPDPEAPDRRHSSTSSDALTHGRGLSENQPH
ncbi:unnamed protein product [Leuciscus chuanchicus]